MKSHPSGYALCSNRVAYWKLVALAAIVASTSNHGSSIIVSAFTAPAAATRAFSPVPVSTTKSPVGTDRSRIHVRAGEQKWPKRSLPRPSSSLFAEPLGDRMSRIGWDKTPFLVVPLLVLLLNCVAVVDVGYVGIANQLGSIHRYDPGLHLQSPITTIDYLSTKTELLEQSNFVPTKEGLTVELDTAVLVRLDPEEALTLYRTVGTNFIEKVVTPEASSAIRGLTSESEAKALYTSGRSEIQNNLKEELTKRLGPRGIVVEDVLLKNVILPKELSNSIQEKAKAEQESQRMEFVLKKERQEAERKAVEAEGIAEFQNIVSKGITPSLLQWKGIEATERLAASPNAKVVIVGNSKDSLPVILGGKD